MKKVKLFFVTTLLALCLVITNSCSQTASSSSPSVLGIFEASTPCDDVSKALLEIPSDTKCELMKWNLTLYQDPKTATPSTYKLICVYGLPKQGTRGFMEGASTIELKGKWTIDKGSNKTYKSVIYKLQSDNPQISLSLLNPDQNLLHLLDKNNSLMVGTGAWSYTLNRVNPITPSSVKYITKAITPPHITTDSSTVGIFDGRTPCSSELRQLNEISADGCQIIKCRLSLFQDTKTHTPTTFQIYTVYVGKGDTRYTNTGRWKLTRGTKTDPEAIVYELEPDSGKPQTLSFLKGDDNILFFLDNDRNLISGNAYSSYTLNRIKK